MKFNLLTSNNFRFSRESTLPKSTKPHSMVDINQIKQWAINRWTLGEKHGISHWERFERNGLLLATPECDVTVIRLFAYLHDSCREDDSYDKEHDPRAAKMIESLR